GDLAGAGFSGAMNYFRPSGTFSFTNGVTLYYSLLACYLFYFLFNTSKTNVMLLLVSTGALLASIPLSISRGLFFQVCVSAVFLAFAMIRNRQYVSRFVVVMILFILLGFGLMQTAFFHTASEAFLSRFESASDVEGGVRGVFLDRYLGGMIGAITETAQLPFFGYGTGMGTNVGSMLLTGEKTFLISEGEWGRLIGESGFLVGVAFICLRVALCIRLAMASFKAIDKGAILPWLLLSFTLFQIPQGQWAQPTSLGFSVILGGLVIAALNDPETMSRKSSLN
ncbi:MAG: hypothetical protein WKF70_05535, partial [Chitinophagaceae bacterium]